MEFNLEDKAWFVEWVVYPLLILFDVWWNPTQNEQLYVKGILEAGSLLTG